MCTKRVILTVAGRVTSLIVVPYDREQTISDRLTRKHGERFVYTYLSPLFSYVTRSRDTSGNRVRGHGHGVPDQVASARHTAVHIKGSYLLQLESLPRTPLHRPLVVNSFPASVIYTVISVFL